MQKTMQLIELKNKYNLQTDKWSDPDEGGCNFHNYLQIYEEMFCDIKDDKISILEIGVWAGESLKLWSKYFEKGEIYGIDIFERINKKNVEKNIYEWSKFWNDEHKRINLYKVDSFKEDKNAIENREKFFKSIGELKFKIIIDDGAHTHESQIKTFNNFKHLLDDGGIYIIEDIKDWCSKHKWLGCPWNPPVTIKGKTYLVNKPGKPWNDYSKCSDTHLQIVEKAIPELKIINLNKEDGSSLPDNIIGYYQKK